MNTNRPDPRSRGNGPPTARPRGNGLPTQRSRGNVLPTARSRGNDLRSLVAYILVAYGLAWLVCLPVWIDPRHLASPWLLPIGIVMMGTPAAATLLVLRRGERRPWRDIAAHVGLGMGGPPVHLLTWLGLVAAAVYACVLGAIATSSLLGQFDLDLAFSGLPEVFAKAGQPLPEGLPIGLLAALMLGGALVNGVLNTIPALGEELGWRGFLFPRLHQRWGTPGALLGTGVIWGLWHAPLVLLGYNYPLHPLLGLAAFCVVCTLLTGVLAWVRQRSGSVWPAAYGHGLFNALAGTGLIVFQRAGSEVDTLHGTILGWSGWLVPAILVAMLLATGAYAARPATVRRDPPSRGLSGRRRLPADKEVREDERTGG